MEIDSRRGQDEETPVWFSGSAYEGNIAANDIIFLSLTGPQVDDRV